MKTGSRCCTLCKETKPLSDFYVRKSGAVAQCKDCERRKGRKNAKEYVRKNRVAVYKKIKEYRLRNAKRVREYQRKYRDSHKSSIRLYAKNYIKEYKSKYPWRRTFVSIEGRTKDKNSSYYKRGIKNYLTSEDIKFLWIRDKAYDMSQPSIDRKNTYGHYTIENCRFIEKVENIRRSKAKGG